MGKERKRRYMEKERERESRSHCCLCTQDGERGLVHPDFLRMGYLVVAGKRGLGGISWTRYFSEFCKQGQSRVIKFTPPIKERRAGPVSDKLFPPYIMHMYTVYTTWSCNFSLCHCATLHPHVHVCKASVKICLHLC